MVNRPMHWHNRLVKKNADIHKCAVDQSLPEAKFLNRGWETEAKRFAEHGAEIHTDV